MTKRLSKDDRIRKLAYIIWEGEGRPIGDHERHWHQARRELEVIESMKASTARSGRSKAKTAGKGARADLRLVAVN